VEGRDEIRDKRLIELKLGFPSIACNGGEIKYFFTYMLFFTLHSYLFILIF
jgi:hypothetical protein